MQINKKAKNTEHADLHFQDHHAGPSETWHIQGFLLNALPMAKASQYFSAIKVDPNAPVIMGIRIFVLILFPNSVSRLTLGKIQSSGLFVISPVSPADIC